MILIYQKMNNYVLCNYDLAHFIIVVNNVLIEGLTHKLNKKVDSNFQPILVQFSIRLFFIGQKCIINNKKFC